MAIRTIGSPPVRVSHREHPYGVYHSVGYVHRRVYEEAGRHEHLVRRRLLQDGTEFAVKIS